MNAVACALDRASILAAASALPETIIDVPEWGGKIRLRSMMLSQRRALQKRAAACDDKGAPIHEAADLAIELLIACVVDGAGAPVFTIEDRPLIETFNPSGFEAIVRAAQKLCGFGGPEDAEARAGN